MTTIIICLHTFVFVYYVQMQYTTADYKYYSMHNFEYENITTTIKTTTTTVSNTVFAAARKKREEPKCGGPPVVSTSSSSYSGGGGVEEEEIEKYGLFWTTVDYTLTPLLPMFTSTTGETIQVHTQEQEDTEPEEEELGMIDAEGNVYYPNKQSSTISIVSPSTVVISWLYTKCDLVKSFRLIVLGPLQEEMIFRAVVFHLIVNRLPATPILSAVLTAFLFGASHAVNANDSRYDETYVLLQIVMAFVIGLFYTMTLLSTGTCNNIIFQKCTYNRAVIIVDMIFISSFFFECLLSNHSFQTSPNTVY